MAPSDPSSSAVVVRSGGEQRLPLGVHRIAAVTMVHSLGQSSLDIVVGVVVAAAAVGAEIVVAGALLDRSLPEGIRSPFHNIVMDSTSCAIRYI